MTHFRSDPTTRQVTTYSDGQLGGDVARAASRILGVELGRGAAQEAGFEDVSTAAIGQEATLVQVHLLSRCLKVEGHCRAQACSR